MTAGKEPTSAGSQGSMPLPSSKWPAVFGAEAENKPNLLSLLWLVGEKDCNWLVCFSVFKREQHLFVCFGARDRLTGV